MKPRSLLQGRIVGLEFGPRLFDLKPAGQKQGPEYGPNFGPPGVSKPYADRMFKLRARIGCQASACWKRSSFLQTSGPDEKPRFYC